MNSRFACSAATALLVAGCADDRIGGNSVETENTIFARQLRVDSLLPDWNHPTWVPTVATLRLDSTNFSFKDAKDDGSDITIESEAADNSFPLPFDIVFFDKPSKTGRIHVKIDPPLLWRHSSFFLKWNRKDSLREDPVRVWAGIPDSQKLALNSFLVDDFEHTTLASLIPSGNGWYSAKSDTSSTVSAPSIVPAGRSRSGNALHISYNAPASNYRYALVGLGISSPPRDFRALDSIVFWVRGTGGGKFRFAFDQLEGGVGKSWIPEWNIDSNWTRFRIRPQDLDPPSDMGENIGWDAMKDSVTNLTFFAAGGTGLWIDDVRLYGINRDDLK